MVLSLNRDEVEQLVIGATIMGTGGGGSPREGLRMLFRDLEAGRKLILSDPGELNPDATIACAYHCGSIRSTSKGEAKVFKEDLETPRDYMTIALAVAEKRLRTKISCILPTELGGGNTAIALHLASKMGITALDADQVGRSAPELMQSTYQIHGVEAYPSIVADRYGNIVIVDTYATVEHYEAIVRSLAVAAGGSVFVIDSAVRSERAKRIALINTVTKAMRLGKRVIEADRKGENPVKELLKASDGFELFSGRISSFRLEERGGFLAGETAFAGEGPWKGYDFKIWVKNENLVAWRDEEVIAMCPDPIVVVDRKGYGITNSELRKGLKVSIIGMKSEPIWRTEKGLELFGPRHFGFKFGYKPIEKLA